ncbi:MAG: tetratricopeptide repeat protein [Cyclobacteriaceae bacterium]|nr:tetratricopeptide repeat protein [Cyclobacteriaceae bacterium]
MKYFVLAAMLSSGYFCTGQDHGELDSLISLYEKQQEDTLKAELIDKIINIELYSRPEQARRYAIELIGLSVRIGYLKGQANGYHRLAGFYIYQDELDSAEIYYQKSIDINSSIHNLKGILADNEQFGLLYIRKNDFSRAFEFLNKNVALFNNRDTTVSIRHSPFDGIGGTFHTLSSAYIQKGMYQLALQNELLALSLYEANKGPLFVADAQNSLGVIEINLGNYKNAISHLMPALETYQKHNDIHFQILALHNLGICFGALNEPEKAKKYYLNSMSLAAQNNYKGRQALTANNLGLLNLTLNLKNEAIQYFEKSIQLYGELAYPPEINAPYYGMGKLYNQFDQPGKALPWLNRAIAISDSTGQIKTAASAYKNRYESYKKLGDFPSAIKDLEVYHTLKDSMYNTTKSQQIEELRTIHDTEKKEQLITQQLIEIAFLEKKEKLSLLQKWLLGSGLALSFLIFGLGFYGIRQKIKRNKLEKQKVDTELAFKKKELTTYAMHLAKKNEVLEQVKQKAKELKAAQNGAKEYHQLIQTIQFDQQDDKNWDNFVHYFEQVHKDFGRTVAERYPEVTKNELRLMALLKMNLSSKEIATILNISVDGIKKARQRLRKKMKLSPEESLESRILSI